MRQNGAWGVLGLLTLLPPAAHSAVLTTSTLGTDTTVETTEFELIFDGSTDGAGEIREFYNKLENPAFNKASVSSDGSKRYLLHRGGSIADGGACSGGGTSSEDQQNSSTVVTLLEDTGTRVRIQSDVTYNNGMVETRVYSVYPSGKLYYTQELTAVRPYCDLWNKVCGNPAQYGASRGDKTNRIAAVVDNGANTDLLQVWYSTYDVGTTTDWNTELPDLGEISDSGTGYRRAGYDSGTNLLDVPSGTYVSSHLFEFMATGITVSGGVIGGHAGFTDDYRSPATLDFGISDGDGSQVGDGFAEGRGAYTLDDADADDHVRFQLTVGGLSRIQPAFEITGWDNPVAPDRILVDGLPRTRGVDYNADVVGTTLLVQYLSDLAANTIFELGFRISGTCRQVDELTNCADGRTVRVAINSGLEAASTTTSGGNWEISGMTTPAAGDVITVYLQGVGDANEAVTVTRYDGTGSMTGVDLFEEHLTIGSDDNQTLSNADLAQYDNSVSGSEDVFHDVDGGGDLTVDVTGALTQEELHIKAGNTFRPHSGSAGNVSSHDVEILGTLTADGNTVQVSGDWVNSGTFNAGTSTVALNGAGQSLQGNSTFYNLDKTVTGADVLTFAASSVTTVGAGGTLTLDGAPGNLLSLVSAVPNTRWNLTLDAGASKAVDHVDVTDSDASTSDAGLLPILPTNSVDGGNNVAWFDRGKLVKRAFLASDGSPIPDSSTAPRGTRIKYLIYLNNPGSAISDLSVRDVLDVGFLYQGVAATGTSSLRVHNGTSACALADCTPAEEATIFSDVEATSPLTEAIDGDVISITGAIIDAGNEMVANGAVTVGAGTVWALSFEAIVQ
ncbi:MAG: hypothetical protein DHS20C01_31110 [marine bacterium B5-7]|nr:MAG: hypothetical protein DHS20C01_31110 [marine bacterium B5-7]